MKGSLKPFIVDGVDLGAVGDVTEAIVVAARAAGPIALGGRGGGGGGGSGCVGGMQCGRAGRFETFAEDPGGYDEEGSFPAGHQAQVVLGAEGDTTRGEIVVDEPVGPAHGDGGRRCRRGA